MVAPRQVPDGWNSTWLATPFNSWNVCIGEALRASWSRMVWSSEQEANMRPSGENRTQRTCRIIRWEISNEVEVHYRGSTWMIHLSSTKHNNMSNPVSVCCNRGDELVSVDSPDLDRLVIRAGHQLLTVWGEVHRPHSAVVGPELGRLT